MDIFHSIFVLFTRGYTNPIKYSCKYHKFSELKNQLSYGKRGTTL